MSEPLPTPEPLLMEIQQSSAIKGISPDANTPAKDFAKLQPGSSLNAVVTDKLADDTFTLKLSDGRLVRAHTQNELVQGQVLRLEVVKAGDIPELKIIWPDHPGQSMQSIMQAALRQLLPKQVNLTDFALALKQAAALSPGKTDPISAAIQSTLETLLAKEDLMTADGVKQGVNNSGVFLEAKIAQQLTPQGDMKAHLLILANALQKADLNQAGHSTLAQTVPNTINDMLDQGHSLLSKTEGAIARIVLDQLASMPQNNEPQNAWQINIPYTDGAHTDTVNLKLTREGQSSQGHHQNWSVIIELNPPSMGIVHCKISLIDDKVDTYFWSDFQASMTQVQDNLHLLGNRYTDAGLAVGNLNVVDASIMKSEPSEAALMPGLLDEFA
jgi:hypothetical protein